MIAVSVIMPVFNSKRYLRKAIESVLNQKFDHFELILIDDGSTDGSEHICDEYGDNYDNVIVIHKKNGGICDARNTGLGIARGEYISFIDNDDLFMQGLLEDNYKLAKKYDADVVRFERRKVVIKENGEHFIEKRKGIKCINNLDHGIAVLDKEEMISEFSNIKRAGALNGIWNGLYKRSIIEKEKIRFDTDIRFGHEDLLFNLQVFDASKSYVFHDKEYYNYFYRYQSSTSAKFDINKVESIWKVACMENKILNRYHKGQQEKLSNIIDHIYLIIENFNRGKCNLSSFEKKEYMKSYLAFIKQDGIQMRHAFGLLFSGHLKEGVFSILLYMRCFAFLFKLENLYCKHAGL